MRHKGNARYFNQDLGFELIRCYCNVLRTLPPNISSKKQIFEIVVAQKASRFWVSEERALTVIRHMLSGGDTTNMTSNRRAMYMEILKRVKKVISKNPTMRIRDAVFAVVNQEAPCFYMTKGSALLLYYRYKKEYYKKKTTNFYK